MIPGPDASASPWAWILLGPVIILGLFIPGHLVFSRLRSPLPWVTAFIGSGLLLFLGVLLLNLTPLRVNMFTLGAVLALASLIGWRLRSPQMPACSLATATSLKKIGCNIGREWWWTLPALIAFASLLTHAACEPLSGFDNFFRWNYLALLIADQGSLGHYPPVTALDFHFYPWCDGIPPLVPIINLWIYLGTGSTAESLIIGRLIMELGLTLGLVWHLARHLWGPPGARVAMLALTTSTLFLWSLGIGQETGLSGVAFLAVAALLVSYRESPSASTAVWIALAAAFGALCRDYNLILIPFALGGLFLAKSARRHWFCALGTAILVVSPWYLRNAWLTGNPLFPHDLGGWLSTNRVHHEFMAATQATYTFSNPSVGKVLFHGFLISSGILFTLALPGLVSRKFGARVCAALVLVSAGLCLASVPLTAGGPFYALRVFGTALPLLAVSAGRWADWLSGRSLTILGICLLPFSADAARRSWFYVWFPYESPLPYTWKSWRQINHFVQDSRNAPIWQRLQAAARDETVVVDHPNHYILLGRAGGNPLPFFSPEVHVLTDRDGALSLKNAVAELRRLRVRFVILPESNMLNDRFFQDHPVTNELMRLSPTVQTDGIRIYDLVLITRAWDQNGD